MEVQEVFNKNHMSEKQCNKCFYYVPIYKDETGKLRPACSLMQNYGHVSHNPARLCEYYNEEEI